MSLLLAAGLFLFTGWSVFGTTAELHVPSGVAVDARGNVFIVDTGNSRVLEVAPDGTVRASFGRLGTDTDGLRRPRGLAIGSDGTLFVADTANHRVQRFSASGEPLGPWGEIGSGPGEFITPSSVALDSSGNLYVTDTGNHRVVRLAPDGTQQAEWGGFRFPHGLAVTDAAVYVTDGTGVHKLSAAGDHLADWSGFGDPYGIGMANDGTLLVADTDTGRVLELSQDGQVLNAWGSDGADIGQFKYPEAVVVDTSGAVYVADRGNDRVQVLR